MFKFPKAIGPYVIIEAVARSAGKEVKTDFGLILEVKSTQGEVPEIGKIVSVGEECSPDWVGKYVLLPHGKMNHVPRPEILNGEAKKEDIDEKLTVTHKANIAAIYDYE